MRNCDLKFANSSNVKIWMVILEMIWSSLSTFQSPTTFHDISSSFIEMNLISMTNDFCTTLTSVFFANDQLIKLIGLFFDFVKEIDSNNYFEVKKKLILSYCDPTAQNYKNRIFAKVFCANTKCFLAISTYVYESENWIHSKKS